MPGGIAGAVAPAPPLGNAMGPQAAPGNPDGEMQSLVAQIRAIVQAAAQVAQSNPALAEEASAMAQTAQGWLTKAAELQSAQTPSSLAVPGGGMA